MIIKENVTLYCCEYCNREMKMVSAMTKHEEVCEANPLRTTNSKKSHNFKDRTGEKFITNEGYSAKIVEYFNATNSTVEFSDGTLLKNISYNSITNGGLRKPRMGEKHTNNLGQEFRIIEYIDFYNCTIEFSDGVIRRNVCYGDIKKGEVKNLFYPVIYGVAYIGEGKYSWKDNKKFYTTWKGILERCYNEKFKNEHPTYKECTVDPSWHNFQVFAEWMDINYNPEITEGWHLDKDILIKDNKVYSPETCCFIPAEINCLFYKKSSNNGVYPIGVVKYKNKFMAQVTKHKKNVYLGQFNNIEEAFQAYKTAKESYIKEVADKWRGQITEICYLALYNYKIEIL